MEKANLGVYGARARYGIAAAFLGFTLLGFVLSIGAVPGLSMSAARAQTEAYIAEIADLPLMPGLSEVVGASVVFDKPSGRIVEAYAQGQVTRAAVIAFYRDSLPQLGWSVVGQEIYAREGEHLTLEFLGEDAPLTLRFTLKPE